MKLSSVLFLAAAVACDAFTIPLDVTELSDGAHDITFDANGNTVITRADVAPELHDTKRSSVIQARDSFPGSVEVGCAGLYLDANTEHNAWTQGVNWCNAGNAQGRGIRTWVDGNSVWYMCVYTSNAQGCSGTEMTDAGNRLYSTCGGQQSGYVFIRNWNKTYGRAVRGESICSNL